MIPRRAPASVPRDPGPRPAALAAIPEARLVRLDVRETIGRGEEPFPAIMAAVAGLVADQVLVLRAPFEPVPLYGVLGKRGFAHWTETQAADNWLVWFYRGEAAPPEPVRAASQGRTLDVRGLEPPLPMVAVLERLETLGPGEELEVLHERRPMFLYPQLDERGFTHRTDDSEPGVVRIFIRRGAA